MSKNYKFNAYSLNKYSEGIICQNLLCKQRKQAVSFSLNYYSSDNLDDMHELFVNVVQVFGHNIFRANLCCSVSWNINFNFSKLCFNRLFRVIVAIIFRQIIVFRIRHSFAFFVVQFDIKSTFHYLLNCIPEPFFHCLHNLCYTGEFQYIYYFTYIVFPSVFFTTSVSLKIVLKRLSAKSSCISLVG